MFSRATCVAAPLAFALLSACTLKFEEGKTYTKSDFTWEESQAHMSARSFHNSALTPEGEQLGLGLVMSVKDSDTKAGYFKLGSCTGFLLDESTLVTNAHCIPEKVRNKEEGFECSDRIKFAHSGSSLNYNCKSVLYTHPDFNFSDKDEVSFRKGYVPDVVILEVEAVPNVRYFTKASETVKSAFVSESLLMSSVDPQDSNKKLVYESNYTLNKIFRVADMELTFNTFRYLKSEENDTFINGNSGSPLHDSNYNVKAIGFASLIGDNQSAIIVDLSCLQKHEKEWQWNSQCESPAFIRR